MKAVFFLRTWICLFPVCTALVALKTSDGDYKNPYLPVDERVKLLLKKMTLDEKVAQLYTCVNGQVAKDQPDRFNVDSARVYLKNGTGFLFMGDQTNDATEFARRINKIQRFFVTETRLGIPALIGGEALHGFVAKGATSFPQNIALGGSFDRELIEKIYSVAAREMRAWGVTQAFCPNVDLGREPRFGRVEETYSEDPYLTSQMGLSAVRGFQGREIADLKKAHVIATLKHFAGHGQPEGGRNNAPIGSINTIAFRENHLYPFEVCVKKGGALCVMASYNDADGIPNHANKPLLTDLLVTDYGFKGYVIGDLGGVRRMIATQKVARNAKEATLQSFNAGLDMELVRENPSFVTLLDLVKEGKVSVKRVDEAVSRILRLKFLVGLFEEPYVNVEQALECTHTAGDKALALTAAQETAVLLKNENLLPLDEKKIKTLAVIGPTAAGVHLGGYSPEPFEGVSFLQGLQNFAKGKFTVSYAEGCKISTRPASFWNAGNPVPNTQEADDKLIAEAVNVANEADVIVLVIGEHESFSREAWGADHLGDRDDLNLPGRQNDLVAALLNTGKPIIAIITGGRPLSFNLVAEKVPAIFQAWYMGEEAGRAMADLLFGYRNPSGKLSISIPRNVGQLPVFYNRYPSRSREYLLSNSTPLYTFGDGLSYTTFSYSNLHLSSTTINAKQSAMLTATVKNTGNREGIEVVQLYINQDFCSVVRPVLSLKDFQRVTLKPGELKVVSFLLDSAKLSFFNQQLKRVMEPGIVTVSVGGNTRQLSTIQLTIH